MIWFWGIALQVSALIQEMHWDYSERVCIRQQSVQNYTGLEDILNEMQERLTQQNLKKTSSQKSLRRKNLKERKKKNKKQ